MSDKKKIITSVGLVILLAFSFLMFFGIDTDKKTGIEISAFIFTIVDEIIIFGTILFLGNKKLNTFAKSGIASSTFIYLLISLAFNVILKSVFSTVRGILVFNFGGLLLWLSQAILRTALLLKWTDRSFRSSSSST